MKAQSCCIPQREITPNGTKQPEWFNKSIAEAISNRQKAYNISKLRPSPETKVAHIKGCRNVDKLIRREKLNEESHTQSQEGSDVYPIWEELRGPPGTEVGDVVLPVDLLGLLPARCHPQAF